MEYDGFSSQYTIFNADVVGTFTVWQGGLYRLKTSCVNSISRSLDSEELIVALARKPTTP
jgi:hypothetical protein